MTDHYDTLGIGRDATPEEIKMAFRRKASKTHPDRKGGSHEQFLPVKRAYDVLSDPERRERYDRTGNDQHQGVDQVEQEAHSRLLELFDQYLEKEESESVNPLAAIRQGIGEAKRQAAANLKTLDKQLAKLERRRDKITRKKPGENLFLLVLDQKVKKTHANIEGTRHQMKIMERVLQLVEDYNCTIIEKPASPYEFYEGNSFGTSIFRGFKR